MLRIPLSLSLFFTRPFSAPFFVLYALCGATDALDGYIARRSHTASRFGEKLDTIADAVMIACTFIVVYPELNVPEGIIIWVLAIAAIKMASLFTALLRHGRLGMIHTYGNKAVGAVMFVLPFEAVLFGSSVFIYIICVLASIASIDELAINLLCEDFDANCKGLLFK